MTLRVLVGSFAAAAALVGQTLSPEQRVADLRQAVQSLSQLHPNLFAAVSREQFQAAADRLESENPQLTVVEFYSRLSALIALAGDAHTGLSVASTAGVNLGFARLPLRARWFSDGVFVTEAPLDRPQWLGARIVSVNGAPIADVLSRLKPLIPHENEAWLRRRMPDYLVNDGFLRGVGIVEAGRPAQFGLELGTGERLNADLAPVSGAVLTTALTAAGGQAPSYTLREQQNYWSEYFGNSRTLYIRYRACQEQPDRPMSAFSAGTLALLDNNPVDTLVFDLRENGGGNSELIRPVLVGVAGRLPRLRENPSFRLYTIADGGTFSSGMLNVEYLKITDADAALFAPGATGLGSLLVGEPTGGKPGHFGEVRNFALNNSRLTIQHSTRRFDALPWIPDLDAIYPDVLFRLRSTDYFTRHDAWLALASNRVARTAAAPEGDVVVVNAASFRPEQGLAPGAFAAAFGDFPNGPLEVLVDGRRCEVAAATPTQITFRVPLETATGMMSIEVRNAQGASGRGRFEVSAAAPALFVMRGSDPTQPGAVLNEDNRLNGRDAPARRGSTIQIFGTGNASGGNPTVWIGERVAAVQYSGMTAPGLWQINAVVPADVARGLVPVYVAAGGLASNAVTIVVE